MIKIGDFRIDVAITERHQYDSVVTSDPVETGTSVTDNIRLRPFTLTLSGIVTDTPIGDIIDERDPNEIPSNAALDFFKKLREDREPVTVETSIAKYENMVLERLSIPMSDNEGDSLQFTASFIQINLITNDRQTIKVKNPKYSRKKKKGPIKVEEVAPAPVTQDKAKKAVSQERKAVMEGRG